MLTQSRAYLTILLADPMSRDSMKLLITTTDYVALSYLHGNVVFICPLFLVGVESGRSVAAQF